MASRAILRKMRICAGIALVVARSCPAGEINAQTVGPSFDCGRAGTPTEHAICSFRALASLDRSLAEAYSTHLSQLAGEARTNFRELQKAWLMKRDRCGGDRYCLEATMRSRLQSLTADPIGASSPDVGAGAGFLGVWRPYSDPVQWLGVMTIGKDKLVYKEGSRAGLLPVRDGGSVFRLAGPEGEVFNCGNEPAIFIGFQELGNGLLAVLQYQGDPPPPEPTGSSVAEVVRNGTCSVMFYSR